MTVESVPVQSSASFVGVRASAPELISLLLLLPLAQL